MPESEAKKKWMQENTKMFTLKLQYKGDSDLIEYLQDQPNRQGEIKRLLRLAMAIEAKENKKE